MSVASSLRSVRWAQLALELVVVVVGILLALGIDSWRAERADRTLETSLLARLDEDLSRAVRQLQPQLDQTAEAGQAAVNLLAASSGDMSPPNDSIAQWLVRISWWSDPYPSMASAQALVSSNSLRTIRSESLRSSIVTFLDQVRQLESRIPRHEAELTQWMTSVNDLIDPTIRGQEVFVGVLGGGVEAYAQTAVPQADLTPLIRTDAFARSSRRIFWAHENLRWLQAMILEATRQLRNEVRLVSSGGDA